MLVLVAYGIGGESVKHLRRLFGAVVFVSGITHTGGVCAGGAYIGGAVGATRFDDGGHLELDGYRVYMTDLDIPAAPPDWMITQTITTSTRTDFDDSDVGYQVYGGYRFTRFFALEGRLTSLGSFRRDLRTDGNVNVRITGDSVVNVPFVQTGRASYHFTAITINALGIYPFGGSGFDIYGQLGAGAVRADVNIDQQITATGGGDGETTIDSDPYGDSQLTVRPTLTAGLGFRYTPAKLSAMTVVVGFDGYWFRLRDDVLEDDFNQAVYMPKLGLQYNF